MDRVFLDDFRNMIETSAEQLCLLSEKKSETRKVKDKWSPKEIIGHLIDSAANNHQRFVRAQFKEDLVFPGYDQDRWVSSQYYRQASWNELIALWKRYNLHLLHVIAHIPEDTMTKLRREHNLHQIAWKTVDQNIPVNLEYLIRDYLNHMKHHLRQILSKK
jgi:hypothetical protein